MPETPSVCRLTAWRLPGRPTMQLIPAPADRAWMDAARDRWPNRCLPLRMANESGWLILNDAAFDVAWNERQDAAGSGLLDWEGHYMRGTHVSGVPAPGHQVRRRLRPFAEPATPDA